MKAQFPVALLASVLCLTTLAVAQDEKKVGEDEKRPGTRTSEQPPGTRTLEQRPGGEIAEIIHNKDGSTTERILSPEEVESLRESDKMDSLDGSRFCAAQAFLRPRRLAPGQSGELNVVVTLSERGNAVVLPGSLARLTLKNDGGPVTFGAPQLDPARPGQFETKYRGKPVYDDSLVFRVPVSVKTDAAFKKYPVKGQVELEFHVGSSGQPLGKFTTQVQGMVWVGKPMPNPAIVRTDGPGNTVPAADSGDRARAPGTGAPGTGAPGTGAPGTGAPGTGAPGTGAPGTGAPGTGAPGTGAPGTGARGTGAQGTGAQGTGQGTEADAEPEEGLADGPATFFLSWLFGGAIVVILILLFVRR